MNDALRTLCARLGYQFRDESLVEGAMRHRSYVAENDGVESNERLEFLGDAILGWVVADLVYRAHADLHEGKLTDLRKSLVNASALAEMAEELGVGECLLLGRGEEQGSGRTKTSILSDALEAIFGAIYLDSDAQTAHRVLTTLMSARLQGAIDGLDRLDAKTRLQEMASKLLGEQVHYKIDDEGPDHDKTFYATVFVGERELGSGEGRSKKAAEQLAAEIACDTLAREHAND